MLAPSLESHGFRLGQPKTGNALSLGFDPTAGLDWFNENVNPAYPALTGYYNEWEATEKGLG